MANKKQNNGSSRFSVKDLNVNEVNVLKMHPLNRTLYPRHVNSIVEDLKNGGLETLPPIIINRETNVVLEGKHRVAAFKKAIDTKVIPNFAKLSALYMSMNKDDEQEYIIKLNNNQKRWNGVDYATSYSKGGKNTQSYKTLLKFCEEHKLCHTIANRSGVKKPKLTYAIMLLKGTTGHGLNAQKIRKGDIEIEPKMIDYAHNLHDDICTLIAAFDKMGMKIGISGEKVRDIISVYPKCAEKHGIETWCKALRPRMCAGSAKFINDLRNKPDNTVSDWRTIFREIDYFINENNIV